MKAALFAAAFTVAGAQIAGGAEGLLHDRYGIEALTHGLQPVLAPLVNRPDQKISITDAQPADEQVCEHETVDALGVYPIDFVKAMVRTIGFAESIRASDVPVSGFQVPGVIALSCGDAMVKSTYIRDSVHKALASFVLRIAPPNWSEWEAAGPPDFRYGDEASYKRAIGNPNGDEPNSGVYALGFVSQLGMTTRENDFGTYAEQVFGHGPEFAAIVRTHPLMQSKLRLLMRSYLQVAPDLADRFKRSGLDQLAALP